MAYVANYYVHDSDKAALKALKAIPGFHQFVMERTAIPHYQYVKLREDK